MSNKTVLVVGGSGGIGKAVMETLSQKGYHVCGTYHTSSTTSDNFEFYRMDLSDEGSVKAAISNILKKHTHIDIVIFSATAPVRPKPIFKATWGDFEEHLSIQLKGLNAIVQNLSEQIKSKHKTKFIIILTEYCIGNVPSGLSPYVAAKYSLMGFAKSLAVELAKYECTVNMVSPGMVNTNLISKLPPKLVEITAEKNPLKRIAEPRDVAHVVLFLADEKSDYLNGVNIPVNGGETL